ncbi:MAG TPA: GvpL/GvpF family gas vesicle protein, partial [Terriglobales bacterium]|nr:GvpL/GvpF family gas vesicle protein [Terriglobales bacterium]
MASQVRGTSAKQVAYLYGISATGEGTLAGVAGVDGRAAVQAIACSGLVCWISEVDKKEFADDLAGNMENLEWLAEVSVRHQQVVAAIAGKRDILPARFGTVFHSAASLGADVAKHTAELKQDLKRISGCEEWGVKIFSQQVKPPESTGAKSGREYLQAKAAALHQEASPGLDAAVQQLVGALEEVAVAMLAGGGPVSRGQRGLQWQGSVLVKRAQRKKLEGLIGRFSQEWKG